MRRTIARVGLDLSSAGGDGATGDGSERFRVERQLKGIWHLVAHAIDAKSPLQAVIRGAEGEGLYRARSASASADGGYHHYWVPPWGQPERVIEGPGMPTSLEIPVPRGSRRSDPLRPATLGRLSPAMRAKVATPA